MPTPKKGARFGGSPAHQRLILSNLATALFEHGRITTTEAKARHLRPYAEKLITKAKKAHLGEAALHNRREVLKTIRDKSVVHLLFTEIAPTFAERPGGYTRITKIGPRKGDNAPMAVIALVTEAYSPTPSAARPAAAQAAVVQAPAEPEVTEDEAVEDESSRGCAHGDDRGDRRRQHGRRGRRRGRGRRGRVRHRVRHRVRGRRQGLSTTSSARSDRRPATSRGGGPSSCRRRRHCYRTLVVPWATRGSDVPLAAVMFVMSQALPGGSRTDGVASVSRIRGDAQAGPTWRTAPRRGTGCADPAEVPAHVAASGGMPPGRVFCISGSPGKRRAALYQARSSSRVASASVSPPRRARTAYAAAAPPTPAPAAARVLATKVPRRPSVTVTPSSSSSR